MEEHLDEVLSMVKTHLRRACKKHPEWPENLTDAALIVSEEAGELCRAVLDMKYHEGHLADVWEEACHTAATAVRLLVNMVGVPRDSEGKEVSRG